MCSYSDAEALQPCRSQMPSIFGWIPLSFLQITHSSDELGSVDDTYDTASLHASRISFMIKTDSGIYLLQ